MNKFFRVVSVSSNTNSFGLTGHVLVARDGKAGEVALNSLNAWPKGTDIGVPTDDRRQPVWAAIGAEIPRRLPDCPPKVLSEVYADKDRYGAMGMCEANGI